MKYEYTLRFRIDAGKAIPRIGDLANKINSGLSEAGYDEKIQITAEDVIPPLTVTGDRKLTEDEERKLKESVMRQMHKSFGNYDVRLISFSCKSVTSKSSVA